MYLEQQVEDLLKRVATLEKQLRIYPETEARSQSFVVQTIQSRVAASYGITVEQMIGRDRHAEIIWPRWLAIYLARKITGMSYGRIGTMFGTKENPRDHGTMIYVLQQVEDRMKAEPKKVDEVERWLAAFAEFLPTKTQTEKIV